MWKFLAAFVVALLPVSAFAQSQLAQATANETDNSVATLEVAAGVVGGVIIADLLTGGALTYPVLSAIGLRQAAPAAAVAAAPVMTPALMEARQAGAVLGETIIPATQLRDAAARREIGYAAALVAGGALGGWLISLLSH